MGYSIDVTAQTFEDAVIQASHQQPILVDFFAQWCGPCQLLKPTLEKLAHEYDVGLAKVDIDHSPELANAYGVEGVPDVRIAVGGQLQPGFVGVIAEPQMRSLLASLGATSAVERDLQTVTAAIAAGETDRAAAHLDELSEKRAGDERVVVLAVPFWIEQGQVSRAQTVFEAAMAVVPNPNSAEMRSLRGQLYLAQLCQQPASKDTDKASSAPRLRQLACSAGDNPEASLAGLLTLLEQDRRHQDAARKAMIAIFDCLDDDHNLTKAYRKKMMMALF
ncbi:MAG: tetratricopeptide repeat protein [Elainellaceae cyanobacterium]